MQKPGIVCPQIWAVRTKILYLTLHIAQAILLVPGEIRSKPQYGDQRKRSA